MQLLLKIEYKEVTLTRFIATMLCRSHYTVKIYKTYEISLPVFKRYGQKTLCVRWWIGLY